MVNQFDVYWVDLNPTIGAEMQKIRPCVIASPKELNDQIRTIDKRRLKNRIATLTADETESLQDVLRQMFCE